MNWVRVWGCAVLACLLLCTGALAQDVPDKAYLQKLLDGWATGNPDGQTKYYAQGPLLFFDEAPLKYNNWEEYRKGTTKGFKDVQWSTIKMNDDAQIHCDVKDLCWSAATVNMDFHLKNGTEQKGVYRWTVIFEKQNGKWLIVHEHVSAPTS